MTYMMTWAELRPAALRWSRRYWCRSTAGCRTPLGRWCGQS